MAGDVAYVGAGSALTLPIAALQVDTYSDIAFAIGLLLVAALPLAVAFAVLPYRLYDIDRLINRTVVYGGLTAILAGLYAAVLAGLTKLVEDAVDRRIATDERSLE